MNTDQELNKDQVLWVKSWGRRCHRGTQIGADPTGMGLPQAASGGAGGPRGWRGRAHTAPSVAHACKTALPEQTPTIVFQSCFYRCSSVFIVGSKALTPVMNSEQEMASSPSLTVPHW